MKALVMSLCADQKRLSYERLGYRLCLVGALLTIGACPGANESGPAVEQITPKAPPPDMSPLYDINDLSAGERARATQLEHLYGFAFPKELFTFWRWYEGLSDEHKSTLEQTMAMRPIGPFDVLAGKFDGVDLAYPNTLHWRYQYDPPEFVTVFLGDTDGLHWGLWFDDHERLAPVVAHYYARDAFELVQSGDSLFAAVRERMQNVRRGTTENIEYDAEHKGSYLADLKAMDALEATLPPPITYPKRPTTVPTGEGMGLVVPDQGGDAGRQALLRGKNMWREDPRKAGPVLKDAYLAARRPVLAAIVETHTMAHPILPSLNILDYPRGSFHDFDRALAAPNEVKLLGVTDSDLAVLPDLSTLTNLEELTLYGNKLTDLPESLKACTKLRKINIFRNPMPHVPAVLYEMPSLEQVLLGDASLQGELAKLQKALPKAEIR
ncbi:MAG: DUF2228 domain-containing protein [Nannocystaceae bacterium]|nr:DUF2228 domain-containing protein [Nannocystaceae bacterium]